MLESLVLVNPALCTAAGASRSKRLARLRLRAGVRSSMIRRVHYATKVASHYKQGQTALEVWSVLINTELAFLLVNRHPTPANVM